MSHAPTDKRLYFTSYTGVKLPFKLVNPLAGQDVENRNTFFLGYFDSAERLTGFDKMVYGELELAHRYDYHASGRLRRAEITDIDGEVTVLDYAEDGSAIA